MKLVLCLHGLAGFGLVENFFAHGFLDRKSVKVFTYDGPENEPTRMFCKALAIECATSSINSAVGVCEAFEPDVIVSCHYRHRISEGVIKSAKFGGLNIHPSLLPLLRGCFSVPWAILSGLEQTGFSIHRMTSAFDAGNIVIQEKVEIKSCDTAYSLFHKLRVLGVARMCQAVELLVGGYKGLSQPECDRPELAYFPRSLPYDGKILSKDVSLEFASRFVRAMYFPPHKPAIIVGSDGLEHEVSTTDQLERMSGNELVFRECCL